MTDLTAAVERLKALCEQPLLGRPGIPLWSHGTGQWCYNGQGYGAGQAGAVAAENAWRRDLLGWCHELDNDLPALLAAFDEQGREMERLREQYEQADAGYKDAGSELESHQKEARRVIADIADAFEPYGLTVGHEEEDILVAIDTLGTVWDENERLRVLVRELAGDIEQECGDSPCTACRRADGGEHCIINRHDVRVIREQPGGEHRQSSSPPPTIFHEK